MKITDKTLYRLNNLLYICIIKLLQIYLYKTNAMKATPITYIKAKANDGKVFMKRVSYYETENGSGWSINGDFLYAKKSNCIKATKDCIQNQIEDYQDSRINK